MNAGKELFSTKLRELEQEHERIRSRLRICQQADRRLVRIRLEGRRAARNGSEVRLDGKVIGKVTGGAFAPSCNCAMALAWVDTACAVPETPVEILAGDVVLTGRVDE